MNKQNSVKLSSIMSVSGEEFDQCQKCHNEVPDSPDPDDLESRTALEAYDALECELCEFWFHAECLGLDFEKYKKVRAVEDFMKWFCESCNSGFKKLKETVTRLERRVEQLENGIERDINDKITDIVMERMERDKRKNNLMFFGLPEAGQDVKGRERANFDASSLRALKKVDKGLEIRTEDIETSFRVGKPDPEKTRPLCIKFVDPKVRGRVLRNGKMLNRATGQMKKMSDVYISPDLTKTQRAENRKLYEELKTKRDKSKKDETDEEWVIRRGKVIRKPEVVEEDEPEVVQEDELEEDEPAQEKRHRESKEKAVQQKKNPPATKIRQAARKPPASRQPPVSKQQPVSKQPHVSKQSSRRRAATQENM